MVNNNSVTGQATTYSSITNISSYLKSIMVLSTPGRQRACHPPLSVSHFVPVPHPPANRKISETFRRRKVMNMSSTPTTPCSGSATEAGSPARELPSSTGGVGVSRPIASPPSFASVPSPKVLLSSLGGSGGGEADQSAFRSNDARSGISDLFGANGEIPVIGVDCPCCLDPCPAADDSFTDAGESAAAAAEAVAGVDSGGSSSMWMKSPKLSSESMACAKSDNCASGTGGGAPQGRRGRVDNRGFRWN